MGAEELTDTAAAQFAEFAKVQWPSRSLCPECREVSRPQPGVKASVVGRLALGPRDLERRFGLMGGDIFHGRLSLDQLFSARPVLGHADHRMPVPGLYLCGSGAHPGGGVTGAPGHNAARAVLKDLGR